MSFDSHQRIKVEFTNRNIWKIPNTQQLSNVFLKTHNSYEKLHVKLENILNLMKIKTAKVVRCSCNRLDACPLPFPQFMC